MHALRQRNYYQLLQQQQCGVLDGGETGFNLTVITWQLYRCYPLGIVKKGLWPTCYGVSFSWKQGMIFLLSPSMSRE